MKKILVIEEEIHIRELLSESLESKGFKVIGAENSQLGIQKAEKYLPDIIIYDITMPELDNDEILKTLRQNPATDDISVIFLTQKTNEAERWCVAELEANDDCLSKPFTVEELLEKITKLLNHT